MRALSLFSGIGGIDLAAEWAGIDIAAICEINPFSQKVLKKHWIDVPLFPDITKLNRKLLEDEGVIEPGGTVDIVYGGHPCQPYSSPGKKKGKEDERDLWPEAYRIIRELKPSWYVGENVDNLTNMAEFEESINNLEKINYKTQSFIISAKSVGAPHRRNRVFIVANSNSESKLQTNQKFNTIRKEWNTWENTSWRVRGKISTTYWEENKPPICGMDDGFSDRFYKDRMIALGNAVIPQQIYPILKAIVDIEEGRI